MIIAIIVCNSLYLSTIKLQQFSLITKFTGTYNSSNSRYFTATVDKELYTQFVVYSYNKNGSTKSDYLTVAPLSPAQQLFDIKLGSDKIDLSYSNRRSLLKNATYVIYSTTYNNVSPLKEGVIEARNSTIDISDINSGSYILTIQIQGRQQYLKFSK